MIGLQVLTIKYHFAQSKIIDLVGGHCQNIDQALNETERDAASWTQYKICFHSLIVVHIHVNVSYWRTSITKLQKPSNSSEMWPEQPSETED